MLAQNENRIPQALVDRKTMWWRNLRMSIFNSSILFSFFFFIIIVQSQFQYYYSFNHVPDEVILSRTMYTITDMNTTFPQITTTPFYFSQYQLYPLYLHFFLRICFFDSWISLPLGSLFQNIIVTSSFYYMLSTCNIVTSPVISTHLFSIYPFSFIIQRNVPIPTSLCLSFECLSFAFLKKKKIFFTSLCCFLAILTSFHGIISSISILFYLLHQKNFKFFLTLLMISSSAFFVLMLESKILYNYKFAFIDEIKNYFSLDPFESIRLIREKRPIYFIFGFVLSSAFPAIIGTIRLRAISLPLFIYCMFSFFFVIYFNKVDLEFYTVGLSVFSVIIGFDEPLHYLVTMLPSPLLLNLIEFVIYFFAAHFLREHSMDQKYAEYSMNLQ